MNHILFFVYIRRALIRSDTKTRMNQMTAQCNTQTLQQQQKLIRHNQKTLYSLVYNEKSAAQYQD